VTIDERFEQLTIALAENANATAENTKSIAQLTNLVLTQHESIKSLETSALAHDAQIDVLTEKYQEAR
jgi:hypothetical protein